MTNLFFILLIVLTPFSAMQYMPRAVLGIPGFNPFNLLWLVCFAIIVGSFRQDGVKRLFPYFTVPLICFLIAYSISVVWTSLNIDSLHPPPNYQVTGYSIQLFLLEILIKPFQFVLIGWMAYKYCLLHGSEGINKAIQIIPLIMLPFVVFLFFSASAGGAADYREGRLLLAAIGYHANGLGALSASIFAYLMGSVGGKSKSLWYISIASIIIIMILSFSRASYVSAIITVILSFKAITTKQRVTMVVLVFFIVLSFLPLLMSRIQFGIEQKDADLATMDLGEVSAGRISHIWPMSIEKISEHPFVGQGHFSIWKDPKGSSYVNLPSHPHNAFLQIALDMGAVGVIILAAFIISLWARSAIDRRLRLALISWMVMAMTGQTFYPALANSMVWIFYGIVSANRMPTAPKSLA